MVKADLSRDYYGDLEILPTADTAEIKKQFKKLALTYHPDRNPGRESEVTAKFQRIQSAHEVLTDPTERAKYDANRTRAPGGFRNSYTGGTASGMKGNPWSNVSSQFPTPPRPPTSRNRQPPPPSSGARRYEKFATPNTSAYQAAQEGPRARQDTYEAWENLKHRDRTEPGPSKTSRAPPQPPPRNPPQSGRADNVRPQPQPSSKYRPNFDEYREPDSAHRRSQSSNASASRKGFMPNTPGGDEPPAPMGAYFTNRNKATAPPDQPLRQPPPHSSYTSASNVGPDPLRQFRERDMPSMEPRLSTPYATHGGEKFDLFDGPNMSRSKSTRERNDRFDKESVPRTDSDSSLNSPHRSRSFAQRPSAQSKPTNEKTRHESSSSDELPRMNGSANRSNGSAPRRAPQASDDAQQPAQTRKQSKISMMRQWMNENPGQEPPPDGFPPDGPPLRSGQPSSTTDSTNGTNGTNAQPSMYANPDSLPLFKSNNTNATNPFLLKHPAVSQVMPQPGNISQKEEIKLSALRSDPVAFGAKVSARYPSGIAASSGELNVFEAKQRDFIDRLLSNKQTPSWSQKSSDDSHQSNGNHPSQCDNWNCYRESTELGSPSKKSKSMHRYSNFEPLRAFWQNKQGLKNSANSSYNTRFSFNIGKDTFTPTQPQPQRNGFSSSAENISTKFTPEDWAGKFEAGADYFKPAPAPKAGSGPSVRPRAQSASRSRGRSPPKVRTTVDPTSMPPRTDQEAPIESPGGTKFSPEEWAETFAPQTFMPPPNPAVTPRPQAYRKRTIPSVRPTMGGHAAVVDEGDTSEEQPLFTKPKVASPQSASPDPMDVDTPPVSHTIPLFAPKFGENPNLNIDPLKRPAASSASRSASQSPTDEEDLKVNFEDLKIRDIITSLDMPLPPSPPIPPQATEFELPSRQAYEEYLKRYEDYMAAWDLTNTKFLLHVVARKNQNDISLSKRWTDEKSTETYRLGLKEDQAVLKKWSELTEKHEKVVKDYVILKARMKARVQKEDVKPAELEKESVLRPRKKTH